MIFALMIYFFLLKLPVPTSLVVVMFFATRVSSEIGVAMVSHLCDSHEGRSPGVHLTSFAGWIAELLSLNKLCIKCGISLG